jgi:serine/threonine protein kinase
MDEIYYARDTRLERGVAIKILPAAFSADRERLHRFDREGRLASALNHPISLPSTNSGRMDGSYSLYCDGAGNRTPSERIDPGISIVQESVRLRQEKPCPKRNASGVAPCRRS